MRILLCILLISFVQDVFGKNKPLLTLTLGHHDIERIHLVERSPSTYVIQLERNHLLLKQRMITKESFKTIETDWNFVLKTSVPRKVSAQGFCGDRMVLTNHQAKNQKYPFCFSDLSKESQLRIQSFQKKLRDLASQNSPVYIKL